jgi:hypothetical protein
MQIYPLRKSAQTDFSTRRTHVKIYGFIPHPMSRFRSAIKGVKPYKYKIG